MTIDDFPLLAREFSPLDERMEASIVERLQEALSGDEKLADRGHRLLSLNAAAYCAALLQEVWALRAGQREYIDDARIALEHAVKDAAQLLTELGSPMAPGPACERREPPDYHPCGRRPVVARTLIAPTWGMCGPCMHELLKRPGFEKMELV